MFKKTLLATSIGAFLFNILPIAVVKAQGWESFIPSGNRVENLSTVSERVITILLLLAAVVAVIYIIIGGYQYVTAGGNAEQATAARSTILNALIGLVIIFSAYAIVHYVVQGILTGTPS